MIEQVGARQTALQGVLVFGHQFVEEKVGENLLSGVQGEVALGAAAGLLDGLEEAGVAEGVAAARDVRLRDQLEADRADEVHVAVLAAAAAAAGPRPGA